MKKITFVYVLAAVCCFFIMTSYKTGAGTHGWDCTGAETGLSNPAGCASCHGSAATAAITLSLELDSVGVPVTHYSPGMAYTVTITGTNTGTVSLPKFGLQIGAIKGSVAVVTPVNAGTWMMPFPASTHYAAPQAGNFVVGVVEHTAAIAATTGTGGTGTTYVKTFNWMAPAAGTGTISLWAVLNAVNNNGTDDTGDKWNKTHIIINEWVTPAGIADKATADFNVSLFPNPTSDKIHFTYTLNKRSNVSVNIMDINGKQISSLLNETQNEGTQTLDASAASLNKGNYFVILNVDNDRVVKKLIIQ
jgi:hypothetical protein